MHRIFTTNFVSVYPHYLNKVERKGRSKCGLDSVVLWLTGVDEATFQKHLTEETTFETRGVCGVRVQDIEDPSMQKIRYLDKLVDELAKGKPMDKVLRT